MRQPLTFTSPALTFLITTFSGFAALLIATIRTGELGALLALGFAAHGPFPPPLAPGTAFELTGAAVAVGTTTNIAVAVGNGVAVATTRVSVAITAKLAALDNGVDVLAILGASFAVSVALTALVSVGLGVSLGLAVAVMVAVAATGKGVLVGTGVALGATVADGTAVFVGAGVLLAATVAGCNVGACVPTA